MVGQSEAHSPRLFTKRLSAYETDEGQAVPETDAYRFECFCGWRGGAFYASKTRARGHYERHVAERPL